MAPLNVSASVSTYLPVFGFLLVFAVMYGLLSKTQILGKNKFVHILTSFCIAIIFLASTTALEFARISAGWFAGFIISLLFIVLVISLVHGKIENVVGKGFGWFLIVVLIIIFIFSAVTVFSSAINTYFAEPKTFFLSPTMLGIVILIGITVFASWLMTKKD
ncbi:MAG: hypothetical protein JSW08_01165 [archaeon]|nr:MAG: hypothetical protein JSW08_01165 [archaeon]